MEESEHTETCQNMQINDSYDYNSSTGDYILIDATQPHNAVT